MKKLFTLLTLAVVSFNFGIAQVTQINANKSLDLVTPLNSVKTLFVSGEDDRLWVSEGTLASTVQLSATIEYTGGGSKIGEKFVFAGSTGANGEELFITDGSPGGTILVKDIVTGATGSSPSDFVFMNGFVYFTAATESVGRELWRTNGTEAGTTFVKDINPGAASSNTNGDYNPIENGNHFLFTAQGSSGGLELWKSDGTEGGTILLKDIEPGANGSNPSGYFLFNGLVLFTAKTAAQGREYWRSNGTAEGTFQLKDINPGAASSAEFEVFPGFSFPFQGGIFIHGGRAYFQAYDGVNAGNIYGTDGSIANTSLLKTVVPLSLGPVPILFLGNSISLPNKFFFSAGSENSGAALWQSDGTPAGTTVFKEFDMPNGDEIVYLLPNFSFTNFEFTSSLFQGNKFFFAAATNAAGRELWISDGTLPGTKMVKDIKPGAADGLTFPSYLHTSAVLFFAAENTANGIELWKSDGTEGGTVLVKDINPGSVDSDPTLMVINNSKVFFGADDGVSADPDQTDLFVVDGEFFPLPARLGAFTVKAVGADALLNWQTLQEVNTSHFAVQRSSDGSHFENIGTINAAGNSATQKQYTFTDIKIVFPPEGSLYYRLITHDRDGKKGYSQVVRLAGNKSRWSVNISGDLQGGNLGLIFSGAQGSALIQVYDLSGRQVLNQKTGELGTRVQIPIQNLPSGVYNVSVMLHNEIKTLRFVK